MAPLELMAESPAYLLTVLAIFGLLVGSFLNVVILRLPRMMEAEWQQEARAILELPAEERPSAFNLVEPRSRCPHCSHAIRWYENIPVISWLALRGRCSNCEARISVRYPLIELTAALAAVLAGLRFGYDPWLLFALFAGWCLLALAMIDFDTTLLPDSLVFPLLWAGLLAAWLDISPVSLENAVAGAMAGYLALWSVYHVFRLLTGKEGMGHGDFKLLAALGAFVGWQLLPLVILLSSLVGALVGGLLLATGALGRDQGIPFGPYLAAAGWIAMLWGPQLVEGYFGLMGI